MLLITYCQKDSKTDVEITRKNTDILDVIMALFYIAKACNLEKEHISRLVEIWDSQDEIYEETIDA